MADLDFDAQGDLPWAEAEKTFVREKLGEPEEAWVFEKMQHAWQAYQRKWLSTTIYGGTLAEVVERVQQDIAEVASGKLRKGH